MFCVIFLPESPFSGARKRLPVSRDRVRHGGLPQTAALFPLRDVEPVVLRCLRSLEARPGGGGGQLRGPEARTVSF